MRESNDNRVDCMRRPPMPRLRPWISELWAQRAPASGPVRREHVLPTGAMHLVIRLHAPPLRLFDGEDLAGRVVGHAVVGGARAGFYAREIGAAADSVGAVLRPGAAAILLGVPADAIADHHVALEAFWGRAVDTLREQLLTCDRPSRRLQLFEAALAQRLPDVHGLHPVVATALRDLGPDARIERLVSASGHSHRHFNAVFRAAVGLNPKAYARVLRFQRVLAALRAGDPVSWSDLAVDTGYADQAHLAREFRELAGVSPLRYWRRAPVDGHHLPIDP